MLLESRADPNRCSETGGFPLMLASNYGNVKLARKLLQATLQRLFIRIKRIIIMFIYLHIYKKIYISLTCIIYVICFLNPGESGGEPTGCKASVTFACCRTSGDATSANRHANRFSRSFQQIAEL